MPTLKLTHEVHLEDLQTQAVIRLNESGGFALTYEPVPSPSDTPDESASDLSEEDQLAARDAIADEIQDRWPDSGFKAVFDAQVAAGRLLLPPRPRPNAQTRIIYLRLLGQSSSGQDISVYLNPRDATVTRLGLRNTAAAFPGATLNTRKEVVAPYSSVNVNAMIDALFAL